MHRCVAVVHAPKVPQLGTLVFAVGQHVHAVAATGQVGHALGVTRQDSRGHSVGSRHRPTVPNLDLCVVRAGDDDVWGVRTVGVAHGVDVIAVRLHRLQDALALHVVQQHGVVVAARDDLAATGRKLGAPNAEVAVFTGR